MKRSLPITLFLFIHFPGISFSQLNNLDSLWIAAHYNKVERMIPMRDGVKLFTAIYTPKDESEKYPILLMRTPYGCTPYGQNRYPERYSSRGDSEYFKLSYILVYQDVRGRFMSEGDFEDVRPFIPDKKKKTDIDEASDAYDTIDW